MRNGRIFYHFKRKEEKKSINNVFGVGNIEVYKSAGFGSSYGIKTGLTSKIISFCAMLSIAR